MSLTKLHHLPISRLRVGLIQALGGMDTTMNFRIFLLAAALVASLPATATQVRFTGPTTADSTLTMDTLRNVALLGPGQLSCPTVEAVEVQEILPESFMPPAKYVPAGSTSVRYERWNATFCGKVVALLIAFWPAPTGGMMFQVSYPYPAAEAAT